MPVLLYLEEKYCGFFKLSGHAHNTSLCHFTIEGIGRDINGYANAAFWIDFYDNRVAFTPTPNDMAGIVALDNPKLINMIETFVYSRICSPDTILTLPLP